MKRNFVTEGDCNACRWIQTATNVFRDVTRSNNLRRMTFFNGNKTASIVFRGNAEFILTYEGSNNRDARSILHTLEAMEQKRELTIQNVDDLDAQPFSVSAKILPGKSIRDDVDRHPREE